MRLVPTSQPASWIIVRISNLRSADCPLSAVVQIQQGEHSRQEIKSHAPEALIFSDGNVHHMIGNCDVLVTQSSSVVVVGLALGEEVYSDYDINLLCKLASIQNEDTQLVTIVL
jgi:hypothetical protein